MISQNGSADGQVCHLPVIKHQILYLNKPITCWAPVHFTGAHTKFMTSYCWVKNTYYLPWDDHVPMYDDDRRQMVPYYQWIPFILLAQVSDGSEMNC